MQELVQGCHGEKVPEEKIHEFEIEVERLTSKIDNLKSQNDLLTITLDESKAHSDRLSVLMGKYESNNMALQLAVDRERGWCSIGELSGGWFRQHG
jgi:hypothetical protein